MKRILIIYASLEGQTEKIARTMSRELLMQGHDVTTLDFTLAGCIDFKHYDAFIIGAPVHMSRYPREFRDFIHNNSMALSERPAAFFSVCLGILEKDKAKTQLAERKIVIDFFASTGWHPPVWTIFAGALRYSQYGLIKRQLMRLIAARAGQSHDYRHDQEYTDWRSVSLFVQNFAECLNSPRPGLERVSYISQEWFPTP